MTEAQIMKQIAAFLDQEMVAGHIYWDRLNSGNMLAKYGDYIRNIKLCRKGTADIMVLSWHISYGYLNGGIYPVYKGRITFLEVKRPGKKQNDYQKRFQKLVEAQGAEYHVVHSVLDVSKVLK